MDYLRLFMYYLKNFKLQRCLGGSVGWGLTLDFRLGHDLRVMGLGPISSSALSRESAWDSLPLPWLSLSPSLSQINKSLNKQTNKLPAR